jgi:hypothetical protein
MIPVRVSSASIAWILSLALASAIGCAGSLHAQRVGSLGLRGEDRRVPPPTELGLRVSTAPDAGGNTPAARLLTAVSGALAGIVVGGTAGYRLLPHHDCGCDDPGLDELVYGALVGSSIGAALGAAAPGLGSVCFFRERIGRTLLGAGAAGTFGFIVGGGLSKSGASLITVPIFSVGGALGSLGRCWKVRLEQ